MDPPWSHLEVGERPESGAIRTVRAETSLDVEIVSAIHPDGSWRPPDTRQAERIDWFLAEPIGGNLELASTVGDVAFLDLAEAASIPRSPPTAKLSHPLRHGRWHEVKRGA
jgi:ADP-ribose pyrophosphatase YjhB (NUDIX family)